MKRLDYSPNAVIERSKFEIIADITADIIPSTIESFSDLHNYVDANEYGGICEYQAPEPCFTDINLIQNTLDNWIKLGGHRLDLIPKAQVIETARTKEVYAFDLRDGSDFQVNERTETELQVLIDSGNFDFFLD